MRGAKTQGYIAAEALLMDYAAGALGEAETLLIATHLALSPAALHIVNEFEAIAGALLADAAPAGFSRNILENVMREIESAPPPAAVRPVAAPAAKPGLPGPLGAYLDCDDLSHVKWRRLVPGISYTELRLHGRSPAKLHLLRLDPGTVTPAHQHEAAEMTLVLDGAFSDEFGRFSIGEVSVVTEGKSHGPVACPSQGCICLSVGFAPRQISRLSQRLFTRFFRF